MANLNLRYVLVIFSVLVTGSLVHALQYAPSQDNQAGLQAIQSIPLQIDRWHGYDQPLDEDVYDILETRAILHRSYVAKNGDQVFLSIVHYSDTKVDFHAPEACLGGRGEQTTKSVKNVIIPVNNQDTPLEIAEIVSRNNDRQNLSYYFYQTSGFQGQNYIKMRLKIAMNRLVAHDSSGSLVRLSTDMTGDGDQAHRLLDAFLTALFPIIEDAL